MKTISFLICLLATIQSVRADNWLQNGDFSSGKDHWRGDGQTPAEMTPSNPFDKPDPMLSKGLIIPLKPHRWTKITQDFRTKASELVLSLTYVFSPGLSFSDKEEDYKNIPHQIDNNLYLAFDLKPHQWMLLFTDFGNAGQGAYYTVDAKAGTAGAQTERMNVSNLSKLEDEVITVAFPPGTGNIVLQNISLSSP